MPPPIQRPAWLNFEFLADAVPGAMLAFNGEGHAIYASTRAECLLGLSARAIVGKGLLELTGGCCSDAARQNFEASLAGERMSFDCLFQKEGDVERWIRVSMSPTHPGERSEGVLALLADVTEERRAEGRLREADLRLRGAAAHTPGIIFEMRGRVGSEFRMEYISEAAQKYTGSSAEELMFPNSANIPGLIHPEDLAEVRESLVSAASSLRPASVGFRLVNGDSVYHMYAAYSVVKFKDGSVLLSGVAIDVGGLRATETKLRASQAQLNAIFDNLPFACWTFDLNGRFVLQNPPSEKRWGDTIGKTLSQLDIDECLREKWREDVQRALVGQASRRDLVIQEGGMASYFRRLSVPILDGSEVIGVLGVSLDTTEQRRLENQLAQSQKLDAIGRLAGGIAHDFNNLLTAIMSCVRLLERRLAGPPRRELQIIRDAAQRAAGLTRQLLAFAKQEAVEPRRIAIDDILVKCDRLLRRLIGEDIDLVTLANSRRANVLIDEARLEQAIINLVVNARDALPKGGKINVRCDEVELTSSAPSVDGAIPAGAYVLIRVEDSGVGMSEETRSRAFEPFFTTRQDSGGTGLGLSSVYGSVHQAQGFVTLESELGQGCRVGLYLPRAPDGDSESGSERAATEPGPQGGTETILVVEDEPLVMTVTCQSLRMSGYNVLKARSSRLAMEVASRHNGPIDLLLTDVIMPQGSGPELAAMLLEVRPEIAVLYMSGYTSDRLDLDGSSVHFLAKPFTPDKLDERVRMVLDPRKDDE